MPEESRRCRKCGWPYGLDAENVCKNCRDLEKKPDELSMRTKLGNIPFRDMQLMDEADRILLIVDYLRKHPGKRIAVLVDCGDGYADKGDRYIRAIREKVPNVKVTGRSPGPAQGCETIMLRIN